MVRTTPSVQKLTEAERALLELLTHPATIYARPSDTPERRQLRRAGYIESYRPTLKNLGGRGACWQITPAGRAALKEEER